MTNRQGETRVAAATIIGTAIEWYDFFLYAAAAGLVFNKVFFASSEPAIATLLSFLTVGLSFLFRPLGAFLAGHFGDRIGRRKVLMITLFGMGIATTLIGVLPTYAAAGIIAPLLLIFLRIIQGISAGGEWGGAVLMAVEHAPENRRGLFGAFPQIGVPIGLLMSSGVLAVMTMITPGEQFLQWGWRVPFLISFILIFVGHYIRHRVAESPVFAEISARKEVASNPIGAVLKRSFSVVLLAAIVFAGNGASGYMTAGGFIQKYATGNMGLERGPVLWAVTGSAATWLVFTLLAGIVSDKIGRRNTYILGFIAQIVGIAVLFPLVNTGDITKLFLALALLTVGLGFTYGQQSAFYTELFPASMRFSGVSVSYAIGAILGGAFSPMIAAWVIEKTGSTSGVTYYLIAMAVAGRPKILICDEPTTALDITTEAQILRLMQTLAVEAGIGIIFISHNLRVIAQICDRVMVMYAGKCVESATVDGIFSEPRHPYTLGLLLALPQGKWHGELKAVEGQPPDLFDLPRGCAFNPRCKWAMRICGSRVPMVTNVGESHQFTCWLAKLEGL